MKGAIGFMFFMLFLAGFAFVMLQGRQMAGSSLAGGGAGITAIDWRPVLIGDEPIPDDSGMTVTFAEDGGIRGNGGCNSFFGSLEKTDSGIAIGPLGATRMACPQPIMDRETAFLDALQSTKAFHAGRETLQLLAADGSVLAQLAAAKAD